jgi:hypothetical protein
MADEAQELQMENDLKALFQGQTSAPATGAESGNGTKTVPDTKQGTVPPPTVPAETDASNASDASDASDASEELSEKDKALKALDELKVDEPPKDEKPQLSEEQQIILQHIPDAQTAETLVTIANNHVNFENAFEGGEFDKVDQMFSHWNQQAYDAYLEHVYTKYVASGEWVERFVAEKDAEKNGSTYQVKAQTRLEREVQDLKRQLNTRQAQESQHASQLQEQRTFQAYKDEIDRLFTKVGITDESDKKYIRAAINAEVAADKKLVGELKRGNLKGITPIFKSNANAYLKRDQAFTQSTQQKVKEQEKKKPPVSGGAGTVTSDNQLPEDVKKVPKGQEDNWLSQTLGTFFNSQKKKR